MLSYGLWQKKFQGDRNIIGKGLRLSGESYTVIGVLPQGFEFDQPADIWTPLRLTMEPSDGSNNYRVIGRLKTGVSLDQAHQDMQSVTTRFREAYRNQIDDKESVGVNSYQESIVGDIRPSLLILMGAVGFVLLIACANVANLLLARSAARRHEIAIRAALGATSWRIAWQLITESLLLSFCAAGLGLFLTWVSLPLLLHLAPVNLPRIAEIHISTEVLLFSIAAAVLTGSLFGLAPVLQSTRIGIGNPLREAGTRTTMNVSASRLRNALVIGEVAVSLVLLIGAGLLIVTFAKLRQVQPGFDPHHVLTLQMSLTDPAFERTDAVFRLYDKTATRLEAMPSIRSAALINALPLEIGPDLPFVIEGRSAGKDDWGNAQSRAITPHYLDVMKIPLIQGRAFTERDTAQAAPVVVINQELASKFFPRQNPLGQRITMGRGMGPRFTDQPREVIGVVANTREERLNASPPLMMFIPLAQVPDAMMELGSKLQPWNWVIRTTGEPLAMAEQVRREVLAASGTVPVAEPRSLEQVVGASIARQQFSMTLLTIFAGLALFLGALGLYGVMSYSVAQRTRELGIRSALGAAKADLLTMVIGQGMRITVIGLAIGLVASFGLMRLLQNMLYGVEPFDLRIFGAVTLLLAAVAFFASYLPARRAASIDPLTALREE